MKMTLKRKVLFIVLLSALLVFSAVGLLITTNKTERGNVTGANVGEVIANAEDTADIKAILGGEGVVEKSWDAAGTVTSDGSTWTPVNSDFAMDAGASMRVSAATPGIRFTGRALASINAWGNHETYGSSNYSRTMAMEFTVVNGVGDIEKLYAKADLSAWNAYGDVHSVTASLTFDGLTSAELLKAKTFEVSAQLLMILQSRTPDATDEKVIVVRAQQNDNTRTMESVVNATLLNPAYDKYEGINSFEYEEGSRFTFVEQVNVAKEDTVYVEAGDATNFHSVGANYPTLVLSDYAEGVTISKAFLGAKDLGVTAGSTSIELNEAFVEGLELGYKEYICILGSDGVFYNVPFVYCSKAIKTYSDLQYVRSKNLSADADDFSKNEASQIKGYYIVANDIVADDSWTPDRLSNDMYAYGFCGVFDGQGYTIEYNLVNVGLFGHIGMGAVVKNAAFLAKSVASGVSCDGSYSLLAGQTKGELHLENVYVKYDFDLVNPDIAKTNGQSTGLGLFEKVNSSATYFNNVVVDMSRVSGLKTAEADKPFAWGTIAARDLGSTLDNSRISNLFIISDIPYLSRQHKQSSGVATTEMSSLVVACNDSAILDTLTATTEKSMENVYRFSNFAEAKAYFAQEANADKLEIFNFVDTSFGYPFAGDEVEMIKNGSVVKVNNTDVLDYVTNSDQGVTLNVTAQSFNENVEFTIEKSSGANLVTVDGNTITFTPGADNDGFGVEHITVSITVNGVTATYDITLTVNIREADEVIMYSTMDNSGVIPSELGNVTKIVDFEDSSKVIYDGQNWNSAYVYQNIGDTVDETLANAVQDVAIYVDGVLASKNQLTSYTKVISKGSDLQALRDSTKSANTNALQGYFIVANDIDYKTDPYNISGGHGSYFGGVLDGQGYKVEYGVDQGGLLGNMGNGATIKNISLVLKKITANLTYGVYPILAHNSSPSAYSQRGSVSNAYFAYDIPDFNPTYSEWGSGQYVGIGLLGNGIANTPFTNVMVDMSGVPNLPYGYGAFGTWNANSVVYSTFSNVYVIYGQECLGYAFTEDTTTFRYGHFAESDKEAAIAYATANNITYSESGSGTKNNLIIMKGVTRFDDGAGAKEYFDANPDKLALFTSFVDTSLGYPNGRDLAAIVEPQCSLMLNGEQADAYSVNAGTSASVEVAISFLGTSYPVTLSAGNEVLSVEGNVITYSGVGATHAEFTATANINGVEVSKTFTFIVNLVALEDNVKYSSADATKSVLPALPDGATIDKIVDAQDDSIVYYENGAFTSVVPSNSGAAATDDLTNFTTDVFIYVDGVAMYQTQLVSYTAVLTESADLINLYAHDESDKAIASTTTKGYFILGNDITYKSGDFVAKPASSSYFNGTLDGNGHTLEYAVHQYGLVGQVKQFVLKNISMIVKDVTSTGARSGYTGFAFCPASQDASARSLVENVYFTYDIENFKPDVAYLNGGWATSGLGLFMQTNSYLDVNNTIVDFSKVDISGQQAYGYGAFGSASQPLYVADTKYHTFTNSYVIWNEPFISYQNKEEQSNGSWILTGNITGATVAENDADLVEQLKANNPALTDSNLKVISGLTRFANGEEAKAYFAASENAGKLEAFESFTDTSMGYPYGGDVKAYMASQTTLKLNGEVASEYTVNAGSTGSAVTVTAEYKGENIDVTLSSEQTLVTVSGNTFTYKGVGAGTETITVTMTAEGVTYTMTILFTSNLAGTPNGEYIMYSSLDAGTEDAVVLSEDYQALNITEIRDFDDNSVVIYDGTNYQNIKLNSGDNASSDLSNFTQYGVAYVNGVATYKVKIVSYTKVIDEYADLEAVRAVKATQDTDYSKGDAYRIKGYFIVANNIVADNIWTPVRLGNDAYAKGFCGVFDGQGYTIEYNIENGGLFGYIGYGAVVKNATLLAKSVSTTIGSDGMYSLIAGISKGDVTLENLYVKYDFDLVNPDIAKTNGQSTGLGLFEKPYAAPTINNVIVDMSRVSGLKTAEADKPFAWGTVASRNVGALNDSKISNLFIISDIPYLGRMHGRNGSTATTDISQVAVAGNDSAVLENLTAANEYVINNAYRFADFNEAKEYFAQEANAGKLSLFSFVDTTDGYPFAGDKVAYIKNGTTLTLNNEEKTEYAMSANATETINVALTYNGEDVTITQITHKEGSNLVTIDGSKVTYTAGGENDGFGAQTLTVNATIKDTVVTFDFEVIVNITESSEVIQYSTLNNSGVIPTELGNVTKIAKYSDKNAVIYDGTTWTAANVYQNSGATVTETVADTTEDVVVYVDGLPAYKATIESYSLVITKGSDLQYLRSSTAGGPTSGLEGYFIVANDIDYEKDAYDLSGNTSSYFAGILDGQGYTVEYGVDKYGLLGGVSNGAEIKNISLILKKITSGVTYGVYPILAHNLSASGTSSDSPIKITDAYFAYDIPNFAPASTEWGSGQYTGVGLFGNAPSYGVYTNVMIDMSGVPELEYGYGAFGTWNANNVVYSTFTNTYVIYGKECLAYAMTAKDNTAFRYGHFAESDREAANAFATANDVTISDSGSKVKNQLIVLKGVHRFDDAVAAMAYFKLEENAGKLEAFESFTDTSIGYPFVGDKATAIKNGTTLTLNGEETTEFATSAGTSATINVALTYNGEAVAITGITHKAGSNLVTIDGSTVTYTAGGENDGFGAQTLTVSATIKDTVVTFDFEVIVNITESSAVVQYSTLNNSGVIPTELGNVTKIAKYSNKNAVIYDGETWLTDNVYQNSGETATETVADTTEDVVVYVDGLPAYKATIESYSLVITTGSDLAYLASSTATSASAALEGYFIVANDISYEKDPFVANPGSSCFGGTFDGQGHTVEYAVSAKGLFGKLCGPFNIKNASFVVKAVDNPETITGGKYAMLAQDFDVSWGKRSTISDIYATYDIEGFTPNVTFNGSGLTSGVGLFSYAPSYITYTNVIVDMTNVTVDTEQANIHGYGAFGSNNATQPQYSTFVNTYVIWNNVYTTFKYGTDRNNGYALTDKVEGVTIAESDITMVDSLTSEFGLTYGGVDANGNYNKDNVGDHVGVYYSLHVLKGLTRYDSCQAMVDAGKTTVGGFTISATGVTKA